jgi:hypothetical protein
MSAIPLTSSRAGVSDRARGRGGAVAGAATWPVVTHEEIIESAGAIVDVALAQRDDGLLLNGRWVAPERTAIRSAPRPAGAEATEQRRTIDWLLMPRETLAADHRGRRPDQPVGSRFDAAIRSDGTAEDGVASTTSFQVASTSSKGSMKSTR